jgi:hypothetical protein
MARKKSVQPKVDFLAAMSEKKQHILAIIILFILPVILFFPTVLGDQQFMGHDTIQWRAGAESIFEYRAEHDGEEPLWATNMFGGMPSYVVNNIKTVPHLDNKVFDQLRVIWPAIPYWVLLGGAYLFFILQGFRPLTAALGSIFISFTTYIPIIIGAGHNIKFIAYSFIPWMFCGYWLLTRSDKRLLGFFLFAVACTLNFRAGHPQVTYYFVYIFAALFIYDGWNYYKDQKIKDWGIVTALISGSVILALLGTAEQFWRLMEFSPHSIRGGSAIAESATSGGLSIEYAFTWSQGILETFTLIIPNLFGGDSSLAYWGEKPVTSGPHYFGAIAFLLFLIGIFRSKRSSKFLFLGIGTLILTFSWGFHFPLNEIWFRVLPGFDKFRTPEMWLMATVFSYSIIAIYGLETLFELVKDGKEGLKKLYAPMGTAIGIGVIFLAGANFILPFENEREHEQISYQIAMQSDLSPDNRQVQQRASQIIETQFKPERRDLARTDTMRYLLLIGVGCLMIAFYFQQKIGGGYLLLSLLFLTAADLLLAGNRYISEHALVDRDLELTQVIESQRSPADEYIRDHILSEEGYPYRVLPLDDNPFNNAVPSYFYPSIGGYTGAKLSLIQDVIDEGLFVGPRGVNLAMLDMLNVRFISAQRPLPLEEFQEVLSQNDYYVYENNHVLPKAWFADQVVLAESPREAFEMVLPGQGFDPSQTAIVESFENIEASEDPGAEIEILLYTARRMEFELRRSTPGFLVLSEIYYPPGWIARLNGEEIPIYKTNYLLRGFEIPVGEHHLELEFHPRSHIMGSRISWAANLIQWGIGIILLAGWLKRRKPEVSDEN